MNRKHLISTFLFAILSITSWFALAADPAMIAARQKLFGAENVNATTGAIDKGKVILSWITNASYAASIQGRVILMDTWVTRAETTPGRDPFVVQDLVDIHPEAIFLGHGHFDHADNAAFIAKTLNIPIYASPETCDAMQVDAATYFGAGSTVHCVAVVTRLSIPGTEIVHLKQLEPVACIISFKHLHSNQVPHDPTYPLVSIQNIPDPRDAQMYPPGTPKSYPTSGSGGPGGPIAMFYQIVLRGKNHFTLVWHNTTGPVKEGVTLDIPGQPPGSGNYGPAVGAHVFAIMDSLPRTDVELGAVFSIGWQTNGERDAIMYNQHLRSQVYIPIHQDVGGIPSSSPEWRIGWFAQNEAMSIPAAQRPEPRWMVDPLDYARPLVYDPDDARWRDSGKASAMRQYCGEGDDDHGDHQGDHD